MLIISLLLLVVFFFLTVADIYTTYVLLSKYNCTEVNPIMKKLMDKFGLLPGLLIFKIPLLVFFTGFFIYKPDSFYLAIALVITVAFMTYVVWNNYNVWKLEVAKK